MKDSLIFLLGYVEIPRPNSTPNVFYVIRRFPFLEVERQGKRKANKALLVENMRNETLIAQRLVSDAIKAAGGVLNIPIDKEMMVGVKLSSGRMLKDKEIRTLQREEESAAAVAKKRKVQEINQLQKSLNDLENEHRAKRVALEAQIEGLRK